MKEIKLKETDERKTVKISLLNEKGSYDILLSDSQIKEIQKQLNTGLTEFEKETLKRTITRHKEAFRELGKQ